jgi:hypothetical protein
MDPGRGFYLASGRAQPLQPNPSQAALASKPAKAWQPCTLHDFRRTAITGLQMAAVSEKEMSIMVGATPEVIRCHYDRMNLLAIARRNVERHSSVEAKLIPP